MATTPTSSASSRRSAAVPATAACTSWRWPAAAAPSGRRDPRKSEAASCEAASSSERSLLPATVPVATVHPRRAGWEKLAPAGPQFAGKPLERPEAVRRPVAREGAADHPRDRDRSPEAAVVGLATVVAHHEHIAVRDDDRVGEVAVRPAAARRRVGIVLAPAVADRVPVDHRDAVAAHTHDALDEVLLRGPGHGHRAGGIGPNARLAVAADLVVGA